MWPVRKKIGIDYLRQIIQLAKKSRGDISNAKALFKILSQIDEKSIEALKFETGSQELVEKVREVYVLIKDPAWETDNQKITQILDKILALEEIAGKGKVRVIYTETGIKYIQVTPANWNTYAPGVVAIEEAHFGGTELAEDIESFGEYVNNPDDVMIVAVDENLVVGYIVGEPLRDVPSDEQDANYLGLANDPAYREGSGYCAISIGVLPEYSKKAVGYVLITLLAKEAAARGYKTLHSYSHEGISTRNALRMGGKIVRTIRDYYETGETYNQIVLDLAQYL